MTKLLDFKTRDKLVNYLNSRFGIDKTYFNNYLFIISGHSVSIISQDQKTKKVIENLLFRNFVISFGIELFSNYKDYTPSSLGFGMFTANQITFNFVKLNREEANDYFSGKEIDTKNIIEKNLLSSGFVCCIFDSHIVGTAYFNKDKQIIKPNLSFVNEKTK